jgi:UDP-2,3-diacylglucosamine hydrolase
MEITAPVHWHTVDLISDLHLQASEPQTLTALERYLSQTPAQALFILGDLFEVWVGDDALQSPTGFEHAVADMLHRASARLDVFIMCGNRDFLMGERLLAACGARALPDPSVLHLGNTRWLLVHGDAQCLADVPYQAFRAQVRSAAWQENFLSQPLNQRLALARQMRAQSEAQKRQLARAKTPWIDLDREACLALLETQGADHMIHGHTHQPAQHDLGQGHVRWVLSDWDLHATPARAEVLRLNAAGGAPQRLALEAAQVRP